MKTNLASQVIAKLLGVTLLIVLTGCATTNYQKGTNTSAGLTDAASKIAVSNVKIDATLAALNDMVNNPQGDLVYKFNNYNASVRDLLGTVNGITTEVGKLDNVGAEYFKAWDQQLPMIQDNDIRLRSAQRKAEVEKQFADIKQSYLQVDSAFKPFVSYLKDIQLALGNDLNAAGIASIRDAVDKAGGKAQGLKASVDKIVVQFRDLGMAMATRTIVPASSTPAAPTPAAQPTPN